MPDTIGGTEMMPVLMDLWDRREYPTCPKAVPMDWLSNDHAVNNHNQTLKRLKERGGLGPNEIWCNITGNSIALIFRGEAPNMAACIDFLNQKLKPSNTTDNA